MAVVALGRADAGSQADFAGVFAAHHAGAVRLAYLLCGETDRA